MAIAISGCGSTGEAVDEGKESLSTQEQQTPVKAGSTKTLEFETRTDTVTALRGTERRNAGTPSHGTQVRYMVQIGAFTLPHNASTLQAEARKRYGMPVLNDYHAGLGIYQIRIGFFESRESAKTFRQRMIEEHPADYKDSWIVQLKR